MIVDEPTLAAIVNPRIRQRTLTLPVRRGRDNELLRCPLRERRVYVLRAPHPYPALLRAARAMADRRRAVLWLIDEATVKQPTVTVTVTGVVRDGDVWVVSVALGDVTAGFDRPRLLTADPAASEADYTASSARAIRGEGEAVPESAQAAFAVAGAERDELRRRKLRSDAVSAIDELLPLADGRERKRLRAARNQVMATAA